MLEALWQQIAAEFFVDLTHNAIPETFIAFAATTEKADLTWVDDTGLVVAQLHEKATICSNHDGRGALSQAHGSPRWHIIGCSFAAAIITAIGNAEELFNRRAGLAESKRRDEPSLSGEFAEVTNELARDVI
jgi:hypothetical protein